MCVVCFIPYFLPHFLLLTESVELGNALFLFWPKVNVDKVHIGGRLEVAAVVATVAISGGKTKWIDAWRDLKCKNIILDLRSVALLAPSAEGVDEKVLKGDVADEILVLRMGTGVAPSHHCT